MRRGMRSLEAAPVAWTLAWLWVLGWCAGRGDASEETSLDIAGVTSSWLDARKLLESPVAGGRIVGEDAPCGRYPYMASLRDRLNNHKCGGVLISSQWVLTAAHCVDPSSPLSVGPNPIIVIGACNLDDDTKKDTDVEVLLPAHTILHPQWTGEFENGGDIALLKLEAPSRHENVRLPVNITELLPETMVTAIGWGKLPDGSFPNHLQQATHVRILKDAYCRDPKVWGDVIKDSMFCAIGVSNAEITCEGDSGGPILMPFTPDGDIVDGRPEFDILVGITSFGVKGVSCGETEKPGVYTEIGSFLCWIEKESTSSEIDSQQSKCGKCAGENSIDSTTCDNGSEPRSPPSAGCGPGNERDNGGDPDDNAQDILACNDIADTQKYLECIVIAAGG